MTVILGRYLLFYIFGKGGWGTTVLVVLRRLSVSVYHLTLPSTIHTPASGLSIKAISQIGSYRLGRGTDVH